LEESVDLCALVVDGGLGAGVASREAAPDVELIVVIDEIDLPRRPGRPRVPPVRKSELTRVRN
jgi:hypothetical protein